MDKKEINEAKEKIVEKVKNNKKLVTIVVACVVGILVLILLINIFASKTLKCKYDIENDGGLVIKVDTKQKFKFGKPVRFTTETIYDYSDTDADEDQIDDLTDSLEKSFEESCKKKDGCKFTIKQKKDKVVININRKFDKEAKADWLDDNDYKDYVADYKDSCDDKKDN
jgi:hypothetical protein